MDDLELERLARRRAGAKLGFYIHALIYVLVNLALVAIQEFAAPGVGWALVPALGWGLGLAIHGIGVFFASTGAALRERLVADELRRLRARHPKEPL